MIAPDGYQRSVLLVNGAFPGPTIEANWGDTIRVTVHNNITGPEEGTSIHWHGFLQKNSPWEDGSPAVSQCPLAPGKTFTYQFQATLYGTSWYHSHYSAQYSGGVLGPIVVYGPSKYKYDIDIGPIMLSGQFFFSLSFLLSSPDFLLGPGHLCRLSRSKTCCISLLTPLVLLDWYHPSYFQILKKILAPNGSPQVQSDNNLINGKGNFDCSTKAAGDRTPCTNNAGIAKFKFRRGKTHRLRLINSGSEGVQRFSIDGHTLTVIANDFVPIQAYTTKVVTLGVGQRVDVLVKADVGHSRSAYWMRSTMTSCSLAKQPRAVAAVYYDVDTARSPTSTAWNVPDPGTCANDALSLTRPLYKMALPRPSYTHKFDIALFKNASDVTLWKFDGVSFRGDYNAPTLLLAKLGNTSFPREWNVKNVYGNSSVRVIVNNNTPSP